MKFVLNSKRNKITRKENSHVTTKTYKIQTSTYHQGAWVTTRQIEAARICLARYTKRGGQIWIRIFPHLAKTKKPAEVRMGSGKGSPEDWVAVVRKGCVMFEIGGVAEEDMREALRLAAYKLPIKCKVIKKGE